MIEVRMRQAAVLFLATILPALALPASAAQWIRLSTPDFDLYTDSGEKTGKEILLHFEQLRAFFLRASPLRKGGDAPVRIIEFASDDEYSKYRPNDFSRAYFVSSPAWNYIAMGEVSNVGLSVANHEYTHLIVHQAGLKIPLWLEEGWAEVYSTLHPRGREAAVGDLIEGRMRDLSSNKWLDFNTLTSITHNSADYNEGLRAGIFYAESWALVHMLYLAPDYQENFGKFVMALHQGESAADAIKTAWDRTPDQVFSDLHSYFDRKKIYGRIFEASLSRAAEEPTVSRLSDFDSNLVLGDLLAALGKRNDAKQAYAKLEAEKPSSPDLAESLGYFAIGNRDVSAARRYFGQAFDEGATDPQMCFRLAALDRAAKQPPSRVIDELDRAIKSRPDYPDAQMELGLVQIDARRFDDGISSLKTLRTVTPDRAPAVYCALAYAHLETGDLESAGANLETCRRWAKGDAEIQGVNRLRTLLDGRSRPEAAVHIGEKLQRVEGIVRSLNCSSAGNRLQVQVNDKIVSFDLPAPDAVELTRLTGPSFDFTCGPQKPFRIVLDVAPPASAIETSGGIVRRMEF